ncbi:AAA domain-containing protein, partial [Vibrio aerogenes]
TRELSEVTSLAKCYQHLSCIRPVAHQMSALRHRNRLQPVKNPDERVWSTIAAVLGTKQKRGDFCERVFQENFWKKEPPAERDPASDHLNLWQYKQQYTGLTFEAAKQQFQTALADYESLNTSFVKYDELRQAQEESRQLQTSLKAQLSSLKQTETTLRISLAAHQENQASLKREIEAAQTKLEAIYPEQPGFFARLFNLGTNQQYQQRLQQQVDHLAELQRQLDDETQTAEEHQHELDVNLHHQVAIERQYEEIKADLVENQQVLIQIKEQLKECQLPGDDLRMTDPQVQRQSFWHNRKTNQLRSEVFITAMTLHEAWIMEALDNRHFAAQFRELENLLTAAPVSQKNLSPLALWQMLFMLTPVISTSLPAFSRMFASLPEQSLGWLMILQAGEVEPQAAVGALMRTKRTLVMGDSQQSPAPMIAPPQLIQAQLSDSMGDGWLQWDPASWSLQQIADRVNPYGCRLDIAGQSQWIGIPLWVHRGCTEPMFSLANQFAYHNRLIPVQDGSIAARPHPVLGENRWIHTPGRCTDKQYKEAVGAETLALLMQAAVQPERVEEIYILSPFKAVVSGVRDYLTAHGESLLAALGWDQHTFNHFLRHHTGTISDFQGQSNETVVLLLGCDIEKRSSAEWFTAMPNLLNVALMCARRHLFVIGDATIWSDKPYVESLCHMLLKEEDRQIAAGEI